MAFLYKKILKLLIFFLFATKGVKNSQITKMDIKTKQTKFSGLQEKMCSEVYKVMRGRGRGELNI